MRASEMSPEERRGWMARIRERVRVYERKTEAERDITWNRADQEHRESATAGLIARYKDRTASSNGTFIYMGLVFGGAVGLIGIAFTAAATFKSILAVRSVIPFLVASGCVIVGGFPKWSEIFHKRRYRRDEFCDSLERDPKDWLKERANRSKHQRASLWWARIWLALAGIAVTVGIVMLIIADAQFHF